MDVTFTPAGKRFHVGNIPLSASESLKDALEVENCEVDVLNTNEVDELVDMHIIIPEEEVETMLEFINEHIKSHSISEEEEDVV